MAPLHHESINKGNCQLKTLLIMFSYFFNSSPLGILSSRHSVLANYTCKTNRELNIPGAGTAGSGALSGARVGAPSWVTPQEQLPCSQQGPFPSLGRGAPSQALSGGISQGGKGCPPGTGTADGGTELGKGCAPKPSPLAPQPGSVKHPSPPVEVKQLQAHVLR